MGAGVGTFCIFFFFSAGVEPGICRGQPGSAVFCYVIFAGYLPGRTYFPDRICPVDAGVGAFCILFFSQPGSNRGFAGVSRGRPFFVM